MIIFKSSIQHHLVNIGGIAKTFIFANIIPDKSVQVQKV